VFEGRRKLHLLEHFPVFGGFMTTKSKTSSKKTEKEKMVKPKAQVKKKKVEKKNVEVKASKTRISLTEKERKQMRDIENMQSQLAKRIVELMMNLDLLKQKYAHMTGEFNKELNFLARKYEIPVEQAENWELNTDVGCFEKVTKQQPA
jgi:hypothetical protein